MRRVLLTLEYDGTGYAGWQWQENALAVQQVLERALLRLTGEEIRVEGASRTDAGVHARGQRACFSTASPIPTERLPYALDGLLPDDVRVLCAREVRHDFSARFDSSGKRYTYTVLNREHASALERNRVWHVYGSLDLESMRESAALLAGRHDFRAFMATGSDAKTTVRVLKSVEVFKQGDKVIFDVSGEAFLYNMVRIIAGTLVYIGLGKRSAGDVRAMLKTGNRTLGGPTAPARGLVLEEVFYHGAAYERKVR